MPTEPEDPINDGLYKMTPEQQKRQRIRQPKQGVFVVYTPDGLPTRPAPFLTLAGAVEEVASFTKRYLDQGYYATARGGRIPVFELHNRLTIMEE